MSDPQSKKPVAAPHYPLPAFCPDTGGTKVIRLAEELIHRLMRNGPPTRIHEIIGDRTDKNTGSPVQQVLLKPAVVFEHIRQHQPGGRCYCGIPTCAYTKDGSKIPPIPNMVYCVYTNPNDWFFESGWEEADPDEPTMPLGHQTRFKVKLWPKV